MLQKEEPFYVIIRDKREETENELLSTGKLFFSRETEMGTDRTLVLLSNRAIEKAVTIEDLSTENQEEKTLVATIP